MVYYVQREKKKNIHSDWWLVGKAVIKGRKAQWDMEWRLFKRAKIDHGGGPSALVCQGFHFCWCLCFWNKKHWKTWNSNLWYSDDSADILGGYRPQWLKINGCIMQYLQYIPLSQSHLSKASFCQVLVEAALILNDQESFILIICY